MKKFYYENYTCVFTPDYTMSDFVKDNGLEEAEIVQMFQEDKAQNEEGELYYEYQIIFKIPVQ